MNAIQWQWNRSLIREIRNVVRSSLYATEVEALTNAEIQDRLQHMNLDIIRGKHTADSKGFHVSSFIDGRMTYRREPRGLGFYEQAFRPSVDIIACEEASGLILRYELKTQSIHPNTRRWNSPLKERVISDVEKVITDPERAFIIVSDEGVYLRMTGQPYEVADEYLEDGLGGVPVVDPHLGDLLPDLGDVKGMNGAIHTHPATYSGENFCVLSCYVRTLGTTPIDMIRGTESRGISTRHCVSCGERFPSSRAREQHFMEECGTREIYRSEGRVITILATMPP